jgi:RteC protein
MINEKLEDLFENLLHDSDHIRKQRWIPETERTESCFRCCQEYWELVKEMLARSEFLDDREEVKFFKYIKPRFTGQLEYYTLVYHYLLFCSEIGSVGRVELTNNELRKIGLFRYVHAEFINYMASATTDRDAWYFLRRNASSEKTSPFNKIFDTDMASSSSKDWVLTQLTGYGLYAEYMKAKLDGSLK